MTDRHTHDILRSRLEAAVDSVGTKQESLCSLRQTQWSEEFETLMRNRLLMGRFRYGLLGSPDNRGYNNIGSAKKRLELYLATGNLEHLVDVANLMLVEFVTGEHPNRHFEAADDGIHTEKQP